MLLWHGLRQEEYVETERRVKKKSFASDGVQPAAIDLADAKSANEISHRQINLPWKVLQDLQK